MTRYTANVSIDVKVSDPQALWRKASNYLEDCGCTEEVIGTEAAPNIGACLQMLLDRSEHLDGAEILASFVEVDEPEEED